MFQNIAHKEIDEQEEKQIPKIEIKKLFKIK